MAGRKSKAFVFDWLGVRTALGISQKQFAHAIAIHPYVLQRHEKGKVKSINHTTEIVLRSFLVRPEVQLKLRIAGYPHPFPEDLK